MDTIQYLSSRMAEIYSGCGSAVKSACAFCSYNLAKNLYDMSKEMNRPDVTNLLSTGHPVAGLLAILTSKLTKKEESLEKKSESS